MAVTLRELWRLVDTCERTQRHCMMMENVNFARDELMALNLCRQGVLGELVHGEAAYIHDLRHHMKDEDRGTGTWRTAHLARHNGNLYPTHGLGPVAQYMNIDRTEDRFERLVSISSPVLVRDLHSGNRSPQVFLTREPNTLCQSLLQSRLHRPQNRRTKAHFGTGRTRLEDNKAAGSRVADSMGSAEDNKARVGDNSIWVEEQQPAVQERALRQEPEQAHTEEVLLVLGQLLGRQPDRLPGQP